MKEQLWNLLLYAIVFGIAYYQTYAEGDWFLTIGITILLIGFGQIGATVLTILWYGVVWFWDATVNYSKNRREKTEDEI
jgi:hypothetical protein